MKKYFFGIGIACLLLVLPLVLAVAEDAATVPEAPANLKVIGINAEASSFSLAWDPVPGAAGYIVYQVSGGRTTGWRKWLATAPDPITTPAAEIKRITANTEYWYRVTAYNEKGESLPSDHVAVKLTR